uniref:protein OBERON 3-like n=1 Tax=Erigeron canadensis TaxID=72917 RepID=UPI001CB9857B|nr:protein OBERON 3-like [Erigeron canadensis]
MLKHTHSDGFSGGEVNQSKEQDLVSDEDKVNPAGKIASFEKGSDSNSLILSNFDDGKNLEKGKLVTFDDGKNVEKDGKNLDEKRFVVERDFMQLSGGSSKREIENDDEMNSSEKRPKLDNETQTLDLSLSLPDVSLSLSASNGARFRDNDDGNSHSVSLKPSRSLGRSNSNNTQTTFSNDFSGGSMSYSYSHQFSHNPSCSMTRNSTENHEIWNAGEGTNGSVHSRFRPVGDSSVALVQSGRVNSDNSLSFFPSELVARTGMDGQSGGSVQRPRLSTRPDKILQEVASESITIMAQRIEEVTDETIVSTKEYLKKLITVPALKDELVRLQLRLERRLDLTSENLSKANKNQLEILVSIRTSLDSFLSVQNRLPTKELVEIFLYERCKNVTCKRVLPVEDCECKICSTTKGFCSGCMCPVCQNFDCAYNTCSWVGCDVCSHWCHAVCGLQKNLIKPGKSLKGPAGTTEIQFHCMSCGHASEMFGFIKDVFKSCADQWSLETLRKELDCVWKIFRGSSDFKGKELHLKVGEMISKLDNKVMSPSDVCLFILQFFNYTDGISEFPTSVLQSTVVPLSRANPTPTSFYNSGTLPLQNDIKPPMINDNSLKIEDEWSVKSSKVAGFDSVDSLVRIKEAEASMYQNKADEARKEADGYKQMIRINLEKLDEEYATKIAKLCLSESEERKKQKVEEFKVLENAHIEYHKMKMRMQSEIAGLLQRMENTKKQWV